MREQITMAAEKFAGEVLEIVTSNLQAMFAEGLGGVRSTAAQAAFTEAGRPGRREWSRGGAHAQRAINKAAAKPAKVNGAANGATPVVKKGPKKAKTKGAGRVRRSQAEIEATAAKVLEYVKAHPLSRMEDITKAVGVSTVELARPIKLLLSKRQLTRKGTTRATTYAPTKRALAKAAQLAASGPAE